MREKVSPFRSAWAFAGECPDGVAALLGLAGCLVGSALGARIVDGMLAGLLASLDLLGLFGNVRVVTFGTLWGRFLLAFVLGASVTVAGVYGVCSWGVGERLDWRRVLRVVGLLGGLGAPYFLAGLVLVSLHWAVGLVFLAAGLAAFVCGCTEACWAAGSGEVRAGWVVPVLVPLAGVLGMWLALRLFPLRFW